MEFVYTVDVLPRDQVLAYYQTILPFYEKESVARAHLAFWTGLARAWKPKRILEIGSGLGRITSALARLAPAVGIDISLEMLRLADRRRRSSRARLSFVDADMRDQVFDSVFDLIVAPNDPLSHLTRTSDRRRTLGAVARQLSGRGRFVLDALYRPRRVPLSLDRRIPYRGGELSIRETWTPTEPGSLWQAQYAYRDRTRRGRERRLTASFPARCWNSNELESFFAECGLHVEQLWGDWDRRPFQPGARRLLVVAGKNEDPSNRPPSERRARKTR
jgi:SAM-dependent methyltransferase